MTNYEKIKNMSVEEMALMLMAVYTHKLNIIDKDKLCIICDKQDCDECVQQWLESKVEGEE